MYRAFIFRTLREEDVLDSSNQRDERSADVGALSGRFRERLLLLGRWVAETGSVESWASGRVDALQQIETSTIKSRGGDGVVASRAGRA